MKKILSLSFLVLLTVLMLVSSIPAFAANQKVVTVDSMEEMIDAIASDTRIIIESGSYIAPAGIGEYGEVRGIRVENVSNLTIEANGFVEIKLDTGLRPVFEVANSNNISFVGLSLGHDVPEYGCEGEGFVISLDNSQNITIDNCDLWGCGIIGVFSISSGDINVTNTTIRDCALSAIECVGMTGDIVFDNCQILRNTYYAKEEPMEWTACFNISYVNEADPGRIVVKNSEVKGNYSAKLHNTDYADRFEFAGCTIENNAWDGTVTEETIQDNDYPGDQIEAFPNQPFAEYDESLISVSGIKGYEYERYTVNYHDRVAVCTSPVTVTLKKDLGMFTIMPVKQVGGGYILAEEELEWSNAKYDPAYDSYVFPGKKGDSFTITEPGLYNIFAEETYMGAWTELVIEIPEPVDYNATYSALYTNSKVLVNGEQVTFEAYNIGGNNYFKLRDIAYVLSDTLAQFEVEWDAVNSRVNMISGMPYTPVGGELKAGDGTAKTAINGTSNISKDYRLVSLKAYMINGNNYFKLRDLGILFDFNVSWDGANNCILIDSNSSYIG